jgi:voltage-gated potassium channel Kch
VTAETILGAICAYVLLGLLFAYADLSVQAISSGHFFAQPGVHNEADFVYYSFITITTVGYGDLSPTTGVPRTMAVTEALVGQIFLVVLVARLVSAYIPRSVEARRRDLIRAHAGRDPGSSNHDGDEVYESIEGSEQVAGKDAGNGGER